MSAPADGRPTLRFVYRNHRGETETRSVIPGGLWYGGSPWHPTPGWHLSAHCLSRGGWRDFALSGVVRFLAPDEEV